jgi:hypothetical protein
LAHQEEWLKYLYAKMLAKDPQLPSYDDLKKMGIYKRKDPAGHLWPIKNSATIRRLTR